jgi:hypothetical protein
MNESIATSSIGGIDLRLELGLCFDRIGNQTILFRLLQNAACHSKTSLLSLAFTIPDLMTVINIASFGPI